MSKFLGPCYVQLAENWIPTHTRHVGTVDTMGLVWAPNWRLILDWRLMLDPTSMASLRRMTN